MVGKKRTAADAEGATAPNTRASKAAKVDAKDKAAAKSAPKGRGKKTALAPSKFKESALPLHIHITHTPPSIESKTPDDSATEPSVASDPGHVASISIQPTNFSTGSYGWKGQRKVNIELTNPETGEKETVGVTINVNATVVGSKGAKDEEGSGEAADDGADAEPDKNEENLIPAEGDGAEEPEKDEVDE